MGNGCRQAGQAAAVNSGSRLLLPEEQQFPSSACVSGRQRAEECTPYRNAREAPARQRCRFEAMLPSRRPLPCTPYAAGTPSPVRVTPACEAHGQRRSPQNARTAGKRGRLFRREEGAANACIEPVR